MEEINMGILKRMVDSEYKELKKFEYIADKIEALKEEMANLSD
jgi:preprotein translocase subunit SecA